jgi:hypothetical protein
MKLTGLIRREGAPRGPVVFTGQTHEDLPELLEKVVGDGDNRAGGDGQV